MTECVLFLVAVLSIIVTSDTSCRWTLCWANGLRWRPLIRILF